MELGSAAPGPERRRGGEEATTAVTGKSYLAHLEGAGENGGYRSLREELEGVWCSGEGGEGGRVLDYLADEEVPDVAVNGVRCTGSTEGWPFVFSLNSLTVQPPQF